MDKYPVTHVKNNPTQKGFAEITPDVVFSHAGGEEIKMSLILPKPPEGAKTRDRYPTIVFLQGSGWTFPKIQYQIPQMSWYAKNGYAVAMITHRNVQTGAPGRAFLIDSKCAVRFLRAHAEEYGIDPERIAFWGTSSGGNTSLLMALTGDDPRYKTDEYPEYSDAVKTAIDCFGPTDLARMFSSRDMESNKKGSWGRFFNVEGDGVDAFIEEISPLLQLEGKKDLPPILLLHGDADPVVPYEQTELMYHALIDGGHKAEMICVEGAPHEGSFWTDEVMELATDWIKRTL